MPRARHDRRDQRRELEQLEDLFGGVQVGTDEQAIVEFVIPLLLDVEARYTDHQICDRVRREFDIDFGVEDFLRLQRGVMFQELWPLSDYGTDARISVARHAFVNLLSTAMDQLEKLLISAQTPATVKMRAIERIIEMNKVQTGENQPSNMGELVKFLESMGAGNVTQLNVGTLIYQTLTQEYRDADQAVNTPTRDHNLLGIGDGAQHAGVVIDGEVEEPGE